MFYLYGAFQIPKDTLHKVNRNKNRKKNKCTQIVYNMNNQAADIDNKAEN